MKFLIQVINSVLFLFEMIEVVHINLKNKTNFISI